MGVKTHTQSVLPGTATTPITYNWSVSGMGAVISGSSTNSSVSIDYGSGVGSYTVQAAATNCGGSVNATGFTQQIVWNLTLCSGGNASLQIADANLDVGVVFKDNASGICYQVASNGPLVGTLITGTIQEFGDCAFCFSGASCVAITSVSIN